MNEEFMEETEETAANETDRVSEETGEMEEMEEMEEKAPSRMRSIMSFIRDLLIVIAFVYVVKTFFFTTILVDGRSMTPTFEHLDYLIAEQDFLAGHKYRRGDVVYFRPPEGAMHEDRGYFVKRIIGVPGDTVEVKGGMVYVNDEPIDEPYKADVPTQEGPMTGKVTLEEDHYFVMGDNRNPGGSYDSRFFGPLTRDHIRGVIVLRAFPFSKFALVPRGK